MSEIAIREISPKDRYLLSSGHSTRPSVFPRCAPGIVLYYRQYDYTPRAVRYGYIIYSYQCTLPQQPRLCHCAANRLALRASDVSCSATRCMRGTSYGFEPYGSSF